MRLRHGSVGNRTAGKGSFSITLHFIQEEQKNDEDMEKRDGSPDGGSPSG